MAMHAWLASNPESVANTIRNHEYENAHFKETSVLVDAFIKGNGRLPSSNEMRAIIPNSSYQIQNDVTTFPPWAEPSAVSLANRELTEIGLPPASIEHPYLLVAWGYDVPLFWVSWAQRGNAYTDPSRFYTLGTSDADVLLYGCATAALLCLALLLWQRARSIN